MVRAMRAWTPTAPHLGQFFIYQGFNSRVGWMPTLNATSMPSTSNLESVIFDEQSSVTGMLGRRASSRRNYHDSLQNCAGTQLVQLQLRSILSTTRRRQDGDKYVTIQLIEHAIAALEQSYLRTKARSYANTRRPWSCSPTLHNTSTATPMATSPTGSVNFIPAATRTSTPPAGTQQPRTNWNGLLLIEIRTCSIPKSGFCST